MQQKCGKWMADWRDSKGKRHRAAFPTQAEALAHQSHMRDAVNPKQRQAQSRGPRRISSKRTATIRTRSRRSRPSPPPSAAKTPRTSRKKTSPRSSLRGKPRPNTRAGITRRRSLVSSVTSKRRKTSPAKSPKSASQALALSSPPTPSEKAS